MKELTKMGGKNRQRPADRKKRKLHSKLLLKLGMRTFVVIIRKPILLESDAVQFYHFQVVRCLNECVIHNVMPPEN